MLVREMFADKTMISDANGNLKSINARLRATEFTWDARNLLSRMTAPNAEGSFTHDVCGRRVPVAMSGGMTEYLYDGPDIVLEVTNGTPVRSRWKKRFFRVRSGYTSD